MSPKRIILTTLAVTAAGLSTGASPASAALGECPSGRLCLWFNSDYHGARYDASRSEGGLFDQLFNDGPSGRSGWLVQVEDNAASVANRTGKTITLYDRRNCSTLSAADAETMFAGEESNLGAFGLKNKVSSVYVHGGANPYCNNVDTGGD